MSALEKGYGAIASGAEAKPKKSSWRRTLVALAAATVVVGGVASYASPPQAIKKTTNLVVVVDDAAAIVGGLLLAPFILEVVAPAWVAEHQGLNQPGRAPGFSERQQLRLANHGGKVPSLPKEEPPAYRIQCKANNQEYKSDNKDELCQLQKPCPTNLELLDNACAAEAPGEDDKTRCDADGLWYSPNAAECRYVRQCASDKGFKFEACPEPKPNTGFHKELRCEFDGLWYLVGPEYCNFDPRDADSCKGYDCTSEGQFCGPDKPGGNPLFANGQGYCCHKNKWVPHGDYPSGVAAGLPQGMCSPPVPEECLKQFAGRRRLMGGEGGNEDCPVHWLDVMQSEMRPYVQWTEGPVEDGSGPEHAITRREIGDFLRDNARFILDTVDANGRFDFARFDRFKPFQQARDWRIWEYMMRTGTVVKRSRDGPSWQPNNKDWPRITAREAVERQRQEEAAAREREVIYTTNPRYVFDNTVEQNMFGSITVQSWTPFRLSEVDINLFDIDGTHYTDRGDRDNLFTNPVNDPQRDGSGQHGILYIFWLGEWKKENDQGERVWIQADDRFRYGSLTDDKGNVYRGVVVDEDGKRSIRYVDKDNIVYKRARFSN